MSKTKGVVLGQGYVNHVGPKGAFIGNTEGNTPGVPQGYSGKTVPDQYRGDGVGIDTRRLPNTGTPYQDSDGNPDEARRVAFQGPYGVSPGAGGVDMNDPAANGSGVVFDRTTSAQNGNMPKAAPQADSPVPKDAPYFDTRTIAQENRAHLGQGNASAEDSLLKIPGGVMGRD